MFTTDLTDLTVTEGGAVNLHPQATDADGDTLTYAASGLPDGVTIDPNTGVISGTVDQGTAGTYDISVTVSDGVLADTDTFRMTVRLIGPDTPTGLAASVDDQQVELSWNANSEPDLAGYNLYRSTSLPVEHVRPGAERRDAAGGDELPDTSVTNNTTYYYVVTAVDSEGHAVAGDACDRGHARRVRGHGPDPERVEPVRDLRRGTGAERTELHGRAVVPAHRRGRRRDAPAAAASRPPSRS